MSFELALRLSEALLGLAIAQQSIEHLAARFDGLFALRLLGAILLISGMSPAPALWALAALGVALLLRFDGPYNGGSDKLTMLALICLGLAEIAPDPAMAQLFAAYLAVQWVLSYAVSGWVKLRSAAWRDGGALGDVFTMSVYPVSGQIRALGDWRAGMWAGSWAVIAFEVSFPLALLSPWALAAALCLGAMFHLANAVLFGLNRFFWVWISGYPLLLWFQGWLLAALAL